MVDGTIDVKLWAALNVVQEVARKTRSRIWRYEYEEMTTKML
jgi:hypothetical protein